MKTVYLATGAGLAVFDLALWWLHRIGRFVR